MKKVLSVLLATATAVSVCGGLAACGEDTSKTLLVWAPSATIKKVYEPLAADWKAEHPEYKDWTVKIEAKEENDVQDKLGANAAAVATKANVFFFPSDHINAMLKKNALQPLVGDYIDEVRERDLENVVNDAIRKDVNGVDQIYAFPATYDNGYILYYDKTVYTNEEDVKTLESLQSVAKNADNRTILFRYDDGYYASSLFWGAGCTFGYTDDSLTTYQTNVGTQGADVLSAIYNIFNPSVNGSGTAQTIITGDVNTGIGTGFADETMAAAIGGSWAYNDIKTKMELAGRSMDEIGITTLPTINVKGQPVHMKAFMGSKYCGVNGQKSEEQINASLSLASYLTGEKGQKLRFDKLNAGPSNKNVAALPEVQNNTLLKTINAQRQWSVEQKDHPSAFWSPSIISNIVNGTTSDADLLDKLAEWTEALTGVKA